MQVKKIVVIASICVCLCAVFLNFNQYGTVLIKRIIGANAFVVHGEDGWCFYRGELDYVIFPWRQNAKKLRDLDAYAKAHNVKLIIIPMPEKIDLYPEKLNRKLQHFNYLDAKHASFFNTLKRDNVTVLELKSKLLALKGDIQLFEHDETHLVSAALKVVVEETVREFFDSVPPINTCLKTKKIPFCGILSTPASRADTSRFVDVFYNGCVSNHMVDTNKILIIGDSYANYLRSENGSFGNLLSAYLPTYHFLHFGKLNRGFAQAQNIVNHIHSTDGSIIIWLFSIREFYKPLRFSLPSDNS